MIFKKYRPDTNWLFYSWMFQHFTVLLLYFAFVQAFSICNVQTPLRWTWTMHAAWRQQTSQDQQQTYVVLWGAADAAWLALDALPLVRPHRLHHVVGELQTRGVTCRVEETQGRMSEIHMTRYGAILDYWYRVELSSVKLQHGWKNKKTSSNLHQHSGEIPALDLHNYFLHAVNSKLWQKWVVWLFKPG